MTRIDFYRYAGDKQQFACRLAAKASRSKRVVVYSPDAATLERFDKLLWTASQTSFVPHCFADSKLAPETPVLLATTGEGLVHHDVLLNLGDEWPPFFSTFDRLLEIVGTDEDDKARARARYKFYQQRGYDIVVNDVEAERPREA